MTFLESHSREITEDDRWGAISPTTHVMTAHSVGLIFALEHPQLATEMVAELVNYAKESGQGVLVERLHAGVEELRASAEEHFDQAGDERWKR